MTAGYGNLPRVLDVLERAVGGGGYIAGARFTAADVYVGAQIGWGMQFGTIEARPAFQQYWAKLEARDAWRRASEIDDAAGKEAS